MRVLPASLAQERWARAAWSRVAEPGDSRAARLVEELGPVDALAAVVEGRPWAPEPLRHRVAGVDLDEAVGFARRRGWRMVIPGDDEWPAGVDVLKTAPIGLWVVGPADLGEACARSVAVVGARACTAYGMGVAAELGAGLPEAGYAVVSGAAFGIDRAAHQGCLSVGGTTVAVLAGGLDRPYPATNAELIARIGATGALVSEVGPGGAPTKSRFLQRNRLIATMTVGTVVVEAGLRSGSLNTAGYAAEHGRPVGAVPGAITSRVSAGAIRRSETRRRCSSPTFQKSWTSSGEWVWTQHRGDQIRCVPRTSCLRKIDWSWPRCRSGRPSWSKRSRPTRGSTWPKPAPRSGDWN